MKMKILVLFISVVCNSVFSNKLLAQQMQLKDLTAVKIIDAPIKNNEAGVDKNLIITSPLLGKNVTGKIKITGKANPNSSVKIEVSASYYKYVPDYKIKKLKIGDGPINIDVKNIIVKTNAAGIWNTTPVNFTNYGFSTTFKIVARSVEGKNATYVTVQNNKLPNIAWD